MQEKNEMFHVKHSQLLKFFPSEIVSRETEAKKPLLERLLGMAVRPFPGLLTDTELREDAGEDLLVRGLSGELTQGGEGLAELQGDELLGEVLV